MQIIAILLLRHAKSFIKPFALDLASMSSNDLLSHRDWQLTSSHLDSRSFESQS